MTCRYCSVMAQAPKIPSKSAASRRPKKKAAARGQERDPVTPSPKVVKSAVPETPSSPTPILAEPSRPLGQHGRKLWDDVHRLGQVRGNIEPLLLTCERFDERAALRAEVFRSLQPHTDKAKPAPPKADRPALRAVEEMINDDLERLGLRTILPQGTVEVADNWMVKMAAVRG